MPSNRKKRKATTPEGRVNQLVDMAMDVAEEQLQEGRISPATLNHFLKLATEKERLERLKLEKEIALLNEKTAQIKSAEKQEELFEKAIQAMRTYGGQGGSDEDIF